MRPEPTTAQELGSIVLRTTVGPSIGQGYGCTGERITVGPSLGGPTGRRLLGVSTGQAFGGLDRALGRSTGRQSAPLVQAIAPGSGVACRSEDSP